jgi:MFS family permease
MTVVGVFTLVVTVTGSYTYAGLTSATVGVGTALCGPLLGIAADRFGQRPVLLASTGVHSLALVALTIATYQQAHIAMLIALAFVIGASAPQLAAMSRARLMTIINLRLPSDTRLRTLGRAMSVESMADELVFVFGPVAVGLLAPTVGAWAPLIVAAGITAVCVTGFALHHTASVVAPHRAKDKAIGERERVLTPRIIVLIVAMFATGSFFGSMYTSLTSFMDDRGFAQSTGVVYAAMGLGSAVFALAVVLFPAGFTLAARLTSFAVLAFLASLVVPFVSEIWQIGVVLIVIGVGLGPVLVTIFSLGSQRAPRGRSATVMTAISSSVVVGQSLLTAAMGRAVDELGTAPVLWAPCIALAVLLGAALWNGALTRTEQR